MTHFEDKNAPAQQSAGANEIDSGQDQQANIKGQTPGTRSRLQQLQAYLAGTADRETAQRIEAELQEPNNAFARMLRGLSEHLPGDDPCDIDFSQFFTDEELKELPPLPGAEE